MISKKPLNKSDTDSNSECEHVPSIVPDLTHHASLTHSDQTKDTTNFCSSNNKSPDEEIITQLVDHLKDIDVKKVFAAIDDNVLVRSIRPSLHIICYENNTNTKKYR